MRVNAPRCLRLVLRRPTAWASVALLVAGACTRATLNTSPSASQSQPPAALLGDFVDDYNITYQVTPTLFQESLHTKYRIAEWHVAERYAIARVDSSKKGDAGRWARIDWMALDDMPPYEWAYCLTSWNAPTADSARATSPAKRETPRTGCGGNPFSRMRRPSKSAKPEGVR
jgi:hypothetical protein